MSSMSRLEMYAKNAYECQHCKKNLHTDEGGWYTGTKANPTYNCPGEFHGHHVPMITEVKPQETVIKMNWGA